MHYVFKIQKYFQYILLTIVIWNSLLTSKIKQKYFAQHILFNSIYDI